MTFDMHCGGVEKSLISLLNSIDPKKYDITLLLLYRSGEYLNQVPPWVKIEELEIPKLLKYELFYSCKIILSRLIKEKNFFMLIKKIIKILIYKLLNSTQINLIEYKKANKKLPLYKNNFDLAIDYQGLGAFTTFYISHKIQAKKKATWIHSDASKYGIDYHCFKEYYENYDKIFSVSFGAQDAFLTMCPYLHDKCDVFYNIISIDTIKNLSSDAQDVILPENSIKIATVGRLSFEKGYDIALKAMKYLKESGQSFVYYIIGDGEEKENIEKLIKKYELVHQVVLLGFLKNPYPYIKNCDIYLQTSRFEGFCITLAEARVLKRPIVTTDFLGAKEQITDGLNGFVTEINDISICNALYKLIKSSELRKSFSDYDDISLSDNSFNLRKIDELSGVTDE